MRRLGAKLGRARFDVILVERNRTHIWKPLLHEVAAGSLDANLDEVGYGSHGYRWKYRYFYGSLETIDRDARQVVIAPVIDDGAEIIGRHRIRYDYLAIAIGSVSNDFGTLGVKEHCLFLEDREQADRFRLKLLNQRLRVSRAVSESQDHAFVDVAIVGGGATGVELAAELYNSASALKHYGLEVFDESHLRVTLIEAGPRILPALPEGLAKAAHEELEALGVRVLVNTSVTEVTATTLKTESSDDVHADIKVWAAGVRGPEVLRDLDGLEVTRSNQLIVRQTLQTTRHDQIFAIGDCCFFKPDGAERPVPQVLRLSGSGVVGLFEPVFDCRQPDGQPHWRTPGDRGAPCARGLSLTVPNPPIRHPRLVQGAGADPSRTRQPGRPSKTEASLRAFAWKASRPTKNLQIVHRRNFNGNRNRSLY